MRIAEERDKGSIPVDAFIDDDGKTYWRVSHRKVKEEASLLLSHIIIEKDLEPHSVDNLDQLINTIKDMNLHNYANQVSHRITPDIDMEYIRVLSIIDLIITDINTEDKNPFYIPDGWAKLQTDEEKTK